ncbi:hypothetical protein JM93_03048 [Roseibium hamelinense]|uniref:Uncharacterized protein n=1 Tax=Roseibium hamelinense TaxID=150831 RepID=A0A562SUA1_9HYPH|nr:hypothetical protein JM93_03048 [Roseibium hamelinense]
MTEQDDRANIDGKISAKSAQASQKQDKSMSREDRLAQALRANLKRRKSSAKKTSAK